MNKLIQGMAIAGSLFVSSAVYADVTPFTDDFEGYNNTDQTALENDYLLYAYADVTPTPYAYNNGSPFGAPNNFDPGVSTGNAFSALTPGEGASGDVALSVYSDYDNTDQNNGTIEMSFYKEWTIGAGNVGQTWTFAYDAKLGLLAGSTTASAFIKVLDPNNSFSVTASDVADMTTAAATWNGYILSITIDAAWVGQVFQVGMSNIAGNYEGSSVFYDNLNLSTTGGGGITAFTDDFEGYNNTDQTALENDYLVFAYADVTPTPYAYNNGSPFGAPNNWDPGVSTGNAFSALTPGEGASGDVALSVYSDYDNTDQNNGTIEMSFYKEWTIGAGNVGQTWTFAYDAKLGLLAGSTTASAFIKVLDPNNSFSVTASDVVDMTTAAATWNGYILSLTIDAAWVGQVFQVGMSNIAGNYEGSSVFYDNLNLSSSAVGGGITAFTDDFEGYNNTDQTALENDYLVFAYADVTPTPYAYNNGSPFGAPNNWDPGVSTGNAFSALTPGEGASGDVALSVYSDYDNTDQNNGTIEMSFYKEWTIGAGNVGQTWTFAYDAKLGLLAGSTTASAFIKVLDPNNSFSVTASDVVDMTTAAATWNGYILSLTIDAAWVGQVFQVGMSNIAGNYEGSSVFYDNLNLSSGAVVGCQGNGTDTDGDGVDDNCDNCSAVANAGQEDPDGDGHGTVCDADFNNDCVVNSGDLTEFKAAYFGTDPEFDLDPTPPSNGVTNSADLSTFKALYFGVPGPSGADQDTPPLCSPPA